MAYGLATDKMLERPAGSELSGKWKTLTQDEWNVSTLTTVRANLDIPQAWRGVKGIQEFLNGMKERALQD